VYLIERPKGTCDASLVSLHFGFTTAGTAIERDQFTLLYIELFVFFHDPFMKTLAAEGLTLMFLPGCEALKLNYFAHLLASQLKAISRIKLSIPAIGKNLRRTCNFLDKIQLWLHIKFTAPGYEISF
jgi:hypothetical protein